MSGRQRDLYHDQLLCPEMADGQTEKIELTLGARVAENRSGIGERCGDLTAGTEWPGSGGDTSCPDQLMSIVSTRPSAGKTYRLL
jgi:hypothetical protein